MKIGEFSSLCGVSQSTIRYYVKSGLLLPDESGSQYNFSEREVRDMQTILRLKNLHFSMNEISYYFSMLRHSNLVEPDIIEELATFLMQKRDSLVQEQKMLDLSIRSIDQELASLRSRVVTRQHISGVPLMSLPLLACPHCGRMLAVRHAEISDGSVLSGELVCPGEKDGCTGYKASIEGGILRTGNLYTGAYDHPDLKRDLYRNSPTEFNRNLIRCHDYITEHLQKEDLRGKVILEANINGYFYFYRHLTMLPQDCLLIVADKYPEMLEMYKSLIDCLDVRCNILYIADAFQDYPLKDGCVDLHVSYFGENEHQLYHPTCFLQDTIRLYRPDARLLGAYQSYRLASKSRRNLIRKYPEGSERRSQIQCLTEDYQRLGFLLQSIHQGTVTVAENVGHSFDSHVPGEPLSFYSYTAFRRQ